MNLAWTDEALSEIEAIVTRIATDDPQAALDLADRIFTTAESLLPDNPKLGRPGRIAGTRELIIHPAYIAVYEIGETRITILTVRHTARLWPSSF